MNKKAKFPQHPISLFSVILIGVLLFISCRFPGTVEVPEKSEGGETEPLPPLPPIYRSSFLNPLDTPHTYIEYPCRNLKNKWNSTNAGPDTVVMVILIKNINRGTAEIPESISVGDFKRLMEQLHMQGFKAINTKELQAFLERNNFIPPRSVYLIQTGNHEGEYYENIFRDYYENWGWSITNGWVSEPGLPELLIRENIDLEFTGFLDHQAQGAYPGTILTDDTSKAVIARELQGSIDGLAKDFGKSPVVIVWPDGGFGHRPVGAARQLRFKMGFTSNTRGPIRYNWIPLAGDFDPKRPDLLPEGGINDPLMTLPVYSPQQALDDIDVIRAVGKEAAAYEQANKEMELAYYNSVCVQDYGQMP
jgi:hypothetical protein